MKIFSIFTILLGMFGYSSVVAGGGRLSEGIQNSPPKAFYIKAFDGLLEFPAGIYFDAESIKDEHIRFSNLGAYDANLLKDLHVVIRVGKIDAKALKLAGEADIKTKCYGFNQAVQSIKSETGVYTSTMFYDEKIYVSIMSDDSQIWGDALSGFKKFHNDAEGRCLKR